MDPSTPFKDIGDVFDTIPGPDDSWPGPAQLSPVNQLQQPGISSTTTTDDYPSSIHKEAEAKRLRLKEICKPLLAEVRAAFGVKELKPLQVEAMEALYDGQDVLFTAGTGFGKSMIFTGLGYMFPWREKPVIIIFVPIEGLGNEQVIRLNDAYRKRRLEKAKKSGTSISKAIRDIAILYDHSKPEAHWLEKIAAGDYRYVYISPERAAKQETRNKLWLNEDFKGMIKLVAVDEAHLVTDWYA